MKGQPTVELWVDDHQEYEPGIVTGNLGHARIPLDPWPGDYLVVGDDDVPPALALVVGREPDGTIQLRILPGRPDSHEESPPGESPHSPRSHVRGGQVALHRLLRR